MSVLFTPFSLGAIQIKNRFICSACEDNLATDKGLVTDKLIRKNQRLARGEIGLIISSHMSVHALGRTRRYQLGIHSDRMIPGLRRLVESVHEHDSRIVFQLGHAGQQTTREAIGQMPMGPSSENPMREESIKEVIRAFRSASKRVIETGADGIQLHAAHGYLINQFLSPYFNHREDAWGGSIENRFSLLREIITAIKQVLPPQMILLVKLNAQDYTPKEGITPPLAIRYVEYLADLEIDGLEVSCGTSSLSPWNMCRGDIPVKEILRKYNELQKSQVEVILQKMRRQFEFGEGYNLEDGKRIRPVLKTVPLISVGGWRQISAMEEVIEKGEADLIAMCRPFIKESALVQKIKMKKTVRSSCTNCNKCLAAVANDLPVRCYVKGFPE
jgi:2,4-dienoyl-CoA reductase-like NADH-dependent reductase (Old Yellow Enzyme family)